MVAGPLRELFPTPDIVWYAPGRSQLAGDHQGVDTVLGYFGRTMELTGGSFRVEVHDVVANDEHGSCSTRSTPSGRAGPWRTTTPWSSMSATAR